MINLRYVMLIIFTFYTGISTADDDSLDVTVDQAWGLLLGDKLDVTVDISSLAEGVDKTSLPVEAKRYGNWLYLKNVELDAKQLVLHYLIVNVPSKNMEVETPKFDIKQNNDKWLTLNSTIITIGPALAVDGDIDLILAKPDIKPTLISTDAEKTQLKLAAMIGTIAALILALWHFGWKAKNRQPFAQAVHDLSPLKFKTVTPDQATRILHTAFNHTAGTVVVYGKLDALLEQHPWLQPLQSDIEQFYTQSEQHFFARNSQQGPDVDSVRKLAKACRSKEMMA